MNFADDFTRRLNDRLTSGDPDFTSENAAILSAGIPVIVTVGVIAAGHILTGKRRDNGLWTNPGGHMDAGESPYQAAIREVLEESGIDIAGNPGLRQVNAERIVSHRTGKEFAVLAFMCDMCDIALPTIELDPDQEMSEWRWVPIARYTPELHPNARHAKKDSILEYLGIFEPEDKMNLSTGQQKRLEEVMASEPEHTNGGRFMDYLKDAFAQKNNLTVRSSVERKMKRLAAHVVGDETEEKPSGTA